MSTKPGADHSYKTITIIPYILKGSNEIKSIREKCISFLLSLYDLSNSVREKVDIVNLLQNAMRLPQHNTEGFEYLLAIIIENSNRIINFYLSILENESFDVLICIEDDLFRTYRVSRSIEDKYKGNKEIYRLASLLNKNLSSFKDKINSYQKYIIYKTLVGYNSVFISEWENGDYNYHQKLSFRESEIERLSSTVNEASKEKWHEIIEMCVNSSLNDGATYIYFSKFIELVGKRKPELLYEFLLEKADKLHRLLPCFFNALYFGELHNKVRNTMLNWINEDKFLQASAQFFVLRVNALPDEEIFVKILEKAFSVDNINAITMIIIAFVYTYNKNSSKLIQKIFIPSLIHLTKLKDTSWVNLVVNNEKMESIIEQINNHEIDILLDNLSYAKQIDYSVEKILLPICDRNPSKIINYFKKRIILKLELIPSFESIPFEFYMIDKSLSKNSISLKELCKWYNNYNDFIYQGAKLISLIYTDYNTLLDSKLNSMLNESFDVNLPMIMAILSHYKGISEIFCICTRIILELPDKDERLEKVRSIMLGEAGLISTEGTYGMTHYYEEKKKLIMPLVDNENRKISSFAKETLRMLENNIAQANRRGKSDDEMGKIIYS